MKDKVAIVTGGTRGIGRAIVLELAKRGADVAFNYAKSSEAAERLVQEVKKLGRRAISYQVDVTELQSVKEMVSSVKERLGGVDILVNNAGITRDRPLIMMGEEDWNSVINTNLTGVFNCTKAVAMLFMKQKSGNIVNITSVSGMIGLARQVNYSASKAGIIGFTKSFAKEVSSYNIRVNAVAPGGIETDMIGELNEKYKEEMLKTVPMGRFGTGENVAKAVAFLVSDDSEYITGHVLPVDGGLAI